MTGAIKLDPAARPGRIGGMSDDPLTQVFETQAAICESFGSPFYAGLSRRIAGDIDPIRPLFAPWAGASFEALMGPAVALRFLGAIHDLALSGDDAALTAAFPPASDADAAWAATKAAVGREPARIAAFMGHEPQTNEVRRSACLLPGFLTIAAETRLPLACLELGASAGLNQLWSRFRYDYGAAGAWGDPASPLTLTADWTGPSAPWDAPVRVVSDLGLGFLLFLAGYEIDLRRFDRRALSLAGRAEGPLAQTESGPLHGQPRRVPRMGLHPPTELRSGH